MPGTSEEPEGQATGPNRTRTGQETVGLGYRLQTEQEHVEAYIYYY